MKKYLLGVLVLVGFYNARKLTFLQAFLAIKKIVSLFVKREVNLKARGNLQLIKSDVAIGFKIPSADHVAFDIILKNNKPKDSSLKTWRAIMDGGFFQFTESAFVKKEHQIIVRSKEVKIVEIRASEVPDHFYSDSSPILFYIHGGGYCGGTAEGYLGVLVKLSKFCRCRVFAPDYHCCPEISLDDQLTECLETFKFTAGKCSAIALAGDSAGGGLSLSMLQKLNEQKGKMPNCTVLISPYCDFSHSGQSYTVNGPFDPIVTPGFGELFKSHCVPPGVSATDPKVNALFRSFAGITNVFMTASETEMLYSDAVRIYEKTKVERGQIIFESAPYGPHDYPIFENMAPEYNESFMRLCSFIRQGLKVDKSF